MAIQKIDGDDYNIYQTIYLTELFGQPVNNELILNQIGQEAIDIILNRTASGKDISNRPLEKYSKEYKDSAEFEKYGKTSKVNMELTGDMLGALEIMDITPQQIVIGFNDSKERAKAANHNFGVTLPKREFFGVSDKELEKIKSKFEDEIGRKQTVADILEMSTMRRAASMSTAPKTTLGDMFGDLFED